MSEHDVESAPAAAEEHPSVVIRELSQKARFGGLYYFLGMAAAVLLTPAMRFLDIPFGLLCALSAVPLAIREYVFRRGRTTRDAAFQQRSLRLLEAAFCLNAITWTGFTIYLLLLTGHLGEGAAATLISCAGITAGGVTSLIPHRRLINWYCFFMLGVPGLCAPFLIAGSAGWCIAALYLLYYYYMLRLGRTQSAAYWSARKNYLSLEKYAAEALAGSRAKSDFLARMSHEIRTPMNGVVGIAQLLENTRLDETQRKYVEIIRGSGATLLQIIDDILDFSKLEAGKMTLHNVPFDLSKLVTDLLEIFSLQLVEEPVKLFARSSDDLPQWVLADPIRIRQILYNLVGNAVKFTRQGEIIVSLEFQKTAASAGRVTFFIKDSGIGISKDVQALVFTQFEQFSSRSSSRGTGLGLVICKRLVEIMGGSIGFQSTPGVGSSFWFEIPVDIVGGPALAAEEEIAIAALPSGFSVLVVEDDAVNQLVIQHQLEYLGGHCIVVGNGELAITTAQDHRFDLILMDYNLPGMSGVEATKKIRAWERTQGRGRMPIIALTAHALSEIKYECFEAGMDDYLTKPVIATELRHIVAQWVASPAASM